MNQAGLNMLGLKSESEICGENLLDFITEADRLRVNEFLKRAIRGEGSVFEFRVNDEAEFLFFSSSFQPIYDAEGKIVRIMSITQDVTGRKLSEDALKDSEQRARAAEQQLKDAIESISDGFVLYDSDLNLVICNQNFKDIYDYSDEDAVPGVSSDYLGELDIKRGNVREVDIADYHIRRHDTVEGPPKTYSVRLKDGRSIQIRDRKTSDGGIVSIQSDVTAFEDLVEELRQAHADLEARIAERTKDLELEVTERLATEVKLRDALDAVKAADQAKTDFLATVSHELRTPLNAIIGFTTVMRGEHFGPIGNEKYMNYLDDIHSSSEHLLELINDILDVSAVEAGKLELNEDECSLAEIIEDSIRFVSPRAEDGGISVEVLKNADTNHMLRADERRMRQIMANILSNAVKFTPAEGSVQVNSILDSESNLIISVSDTGIGMSEEGIKSAMQPFVQISNPLSREHEGTGLGLPLTKALAELHGGNFVVTSELGKGTTATVLVPASRIITGQQETGT